MRGRGQTGLGFLIACLAVCVSACAPPIASVSRNERIAIAERLTADIAVLASDEYAGRRPGTAGGALTVDFITTRLSQAGMVSGTNDPVNAWLAPVELISTRAKQGEVIFSRDRERIVIGPDQAIAFTTKRRDLLVDTEMVFVGNEGVSVPEGAIKGSVAVMLAGPTLNPDRRKALETKGASAVIVVPRDAGVIDNVRDMVGGEVLALADSGRKVLGAVVSSEAMARVLGAPRWESLLSSAAKPGFTPVRLAWNANVDVSADRREFTSFNVIGKLPGTRPGTGAVMLLAHWDHLGECAPGKSNPICRGAVDNASGLAAMIEVVRRLAADGRYERDIYAVATTAEEAGLLGARALVENPPLPLSDIVAAFNFDTVAVAPAGSPVGFVGEGRTGLDSLVLETLAEAKRDLGDKEFARSFLQRQDGWVLLEEGVPALLISTAFASEITTGPYFENRYHSPADDAASVELGGAIDDLLLHQELVRRLAIPATQTTAAQQ